MTPVTTPRDAGLCFHTAGHRQPPGLPGWVGTADVTVLIARGGKPATLPKTQARDRGGRKRAEEDTRTKRKRPWRRASCLPPPSLVSFLLLPPLQSQGYQLEC